MSVSTLAGLEGMPAHRVTSAVYEGTPIGKGESRAVFSVSETVVVKIALNEFGHTDNFQEFSIWSAVSETSDSQFFTKVYAHGADWSWIACERVERGIGTDDVTEFEEAMKRHGIGDLWFVRGPMAGELANQNVGHRADGQTVVLDFAWRY